MAIRNVALSRRSRSPIARPFIQALDIWTVARLALSFDLALSALESKHGAVLWMTDFVEASEITKIGFHSRRLPISYPSRPEYGFSGSRFAIKWPARS
jgi:hypothetical protein